MLYLAAKDYFPTNAVVIGIFAAIMGQGGSWVYNAALKINTQNFRAEDRGKVPQHTHTHTHTHNPGQH